MPEASRGDPPNRTHRMSQEHTTRFEECQRIRLAFVKIHVLGRWFSGWNNPPPLR